MQNSIKDYNMLTSIFVKINFLREIVFVVQGVHVGVTNIGWFAFVHGLIKLVAVYVVK